MTYKADFSDEFLRIAEKLKRKDYGTFTRLQSKIEGDYVRFVTFKHHDEAYRRL